MRKAVASVLMVFLILASVLSVGGVTVQASEKVSLIVEFKGKPDAGLIRVHGGKIKYEYDIIPAIACQLPEQAIDALQRNPKVTYVEADGVVEAIGEALPWGVDRIDGELVHLYNTGMGVRVAIIDTGMDYDHPDLDDNYAGGYDFVNSDDYPMDDNGHGTHVAGIIAAEDNEEGVRGVAPKASLYALKALDSSGRGYASDVVAGIEWSIKGPDGVAGTDDDADIISMSLGSNSDSQALQNACDNAYNAGILLIAAAGNDYTTRGRSGKELDTVDYPARYDSVIAVGATDGTDTKAYWSSTGLALELVAPGVSIYSTYLDDTYIVGSGTSMAGPHVSGTAALVFSSTIDSTYDDGDGVWEASEVRQKLKDTADDLGSAGWDSWYGYGLVDANRDAPGAPTISHLTPAAGALLNTATLIISATVTDASGIDADSILMTLDEAPVTPTYDSATGLVSYYVTESLADGLHTVTLDVSDTEDNLDVTSWSFTVDTNRPDLVAGVTVTTVSSSKLIVSWTANTEPDLDHYNMYRKVQGEEYVLHVGVCSASNAFPDRGLTEGLTYFYKISAVDKAGNEGELSGEASGTPGTPTLATMHVASIEMSTGTRTRGSNTFMWAIATVTIVDNANGFPVEGATVYGHWESATTDSDSGTTNVGGLVSLQSDSVKNPPSETTFIFVVDNVVLSGWKYDPSGVTNGSITV